MARVYRSLGNSSKEIIYTAETAAKLLQEAFDKATTLRQFRQGASKKAMKQPLLTSDVNIIYLKTVDEDYAIASKGMSTPPSLNECSSG